MKMLTASKTRLAEADQVPQPNSCDQQIASRNLPAMMAVNIPAAVVMRIFDDYQSTWA